MFQINPERLVDAVATIIKNDGTHSLCRITEARVRSDGALELIFASNHTEGPLGGTRRGSTLFPAHWSMTHYLHLYAFSRTDAPALEPHRTFITAYIISPRP